MNATAQTVAEYRSDCDLISRHLDNSDSGALDELVRRHTPFVRSVCSRMAGASSGMVEDAVQVVLLVFVRKLPTLRKHPNLSGWFWRTCSFVVSDMRRRESRYESAKKSHDADVEPVASSSAMDDALPDDAFVLLREVIAELPKNQRDVIVLHYFQDASYESLAAERGVSVDAVRMMTMKARQRMKKAMSRKGVTLSMTALVTALEVEAKELSIADLSAMTRSEDALPIGENADVTEGLRTTVDAVSTEMDRAAAKAMWWTVGGVAAGLATIGVGTALMVNYLQPVQVPSGATTVWRIESVTGAATVRRGETVLTLKAGDPLCMGDTIVTSSNQEAVVVSDDGVRILLREEGEVGFERRTLNTEHRTSKSEEGYQQFRVVKGSIVAQVKRPTSFATPHAGVETDGADFFLMVATGLTTNGAPWSFSRVDVTEGLAKFVPSSISNLKSEIPLVARQAVCVGTDMEGQTIQTMARKSDCRELSPKYGGVFFREYVELYETKGAALDVLRFTGGRILLMTNAWQMMDKLTTEGGSKIAKNSFRGTGGPELVVIANGAADVVRVSFPLGLPSVDAFLVQCQQIPDGPTRPNGRCILELASVWPLPIQTIGQVVMRTDRVQGGTGGERDSFRLLCIRVGVAPGGRSIYEIDTGRNRVYVQNNTVCNWVYVQDPEKWGLSIKTERMNVRIGAIVIQELRFAQENAGAGGARGL